MNVIFLLGNTLFSYLYKGGQKQKNKNVELKDSINKLQSKTISLQVIIGITVCKANLKKDNFNDLTAHKRSI